MKKILFVGEFSKIATGYGKITAELISRFRKDGYEVAELACFCKAGDPRIKDCDWKIYPNLPINEEENKEYLSNPQNANGKWRFHEALIDFKPNFVFGNGDPFMYEYQMMSPYRDFFNWVVTAPVDGLPQHNQWLEIFNNADGVITYTHWGKKILEEYNIKVDAVIPPVASDEFKPLDREEILSTKESLNITDKVVIGNIMRNQPRKLFNELFEAFYKYNKQNKNSVLYCHTTYPDAGWDLSELLLKHKIINKVLFTYKCLACNQVFPSYFQDMKTVCPFCSGPSKMPSGQNSITNEVLNKIINLFDVYLQLASREGFGIPQIEAAAANVPVITMNYAGMSDMKKSIDATMIEPKLYYLSYPMNMLEAIPDVNDVVNKLKRIINKRSNSLENYKKNYGSWDSSYNSLKKLVDSRNIKSWEKSKISPIPSYKNLNLDNENYVKYLYIHVLNRSDLIGSYSYSRFIKDLNFGITYGGLFGNYFTESVEQKNYKQFNREEAYKICLNQRQFNDFWLSELNKEVK